MSKFQSRDKSTDAIPEASLPPLQGAREALAMSHYDLVKAVVSSLREGRGEQVSDILESLASHSPTRAALVVSEVLALLSQNSFEDQGERRSLCDIVAQSRVGDALRDELSRLPTIDAHQARLSLCGSDYVDSMALVLAPMMILRGEGDRILSNAVQVLDDRRGSDEYRKDPEKVRQITERAMLERFLPLTLPEQLGPGHAHVVEDFYRHARDAFKPELYGYERSCELLTLELGVTRLSGLAHRTTGGEEGYASRLREKAMRARVFVPYSDSPDRAGVHGHQCVDSASVARSFFSQRGIPSDIFLVTVGEMYHNVTVAYFSEKDKHLPVLVDVSPFGGFYPPTGEGAASYWRPQSAVHVFGVREHSLPFVEGFLGPRAQSGMIPWFCEDTSLGRVVGFAGVCDRQVHRDREWERGTDEWYGNGEKVRLPAISLTLFTKGGQQIFDETPKVMFVLDGNDVRVQESSKGCPSHVLAELKRLAATHIGPVRDTIDRLSIPIGKFGAL